jgi:UDP-2-acetamido-3-amino-2,3-dideoxy-glucuronate N-acetyltransferase
MVRQGASVGANVTIVCGVELGAYCMIGAGAVVTRSVPPHALAFGNPARIVGFVSRMGRRVVETRREGGFVIATAPENGEEVRIPEEHWAQIDPDLALPPPEPPPAP